MNVIREQGGARAMGLSRSDRGANTEDGTQLFGRSKTSLGGHRVGVGRERVWQLHCLADGRRGRGMFKGKAGGENSGEGGGGESWRKAST